MSFVKEFPLSPTVEDVARVYRRADAILALIPAAAKSDAVEAAIALVRRIADRESWQSHYGKRWEDEAAEIVAALTTRPEPASTSGRNDA